MPEYVVVTGASKGIGKATALHLDRLGMSVFAGVRKPEDADKLRSYASDRLRPIMLDVTDEAMVQAAADEVTDIVGSHGLFGLVNNAGVAVASPVEFLPLDDLRWQLEVNVVGLVATTQAFLSLIRQRPGRIVHMSSIAGRISAGMLTAYSASKFAVEAIADGMRIELAPWHIKVVCIEPGKIDTPIWATSEKKAQAIVDQFPPEAFELYGDQIDAQFEQTRDATKHAIPPIEVAKAVEKALTADNPPTRILVGRDAKLVANTLVRLPDKARDWLILRGS